MQNSVLNSKPHFPILDGLRGVASVMVIVFHIFEPHSTSHLDQIVNHGYLAVDFFFLLSGFVIGYAYDDRWGTMRFMDFLKLRLVRLQPMVIMGMIFGAGCFYFQDSAIWPNIHEVPVWTMLMVMLIGFTLIPVPLTLDIRGWHEMHPLNGPGWSLFFEYVANILYGLFVRNFSKTALSILVAIAGFALIHMAVTSSNGDVIGGWSVEPAQLRIGITRVMFPFFAGLLLFRIGKLKQVNNAFLWCSLLTVLVLSMPRVGGSQRLWMNGLYDSLSIILAFPFIIYLGASGTIKNPSAARFCKFLGDISYPIYITHFPIIYLYTAWVSNHQPSFAEAWPFALLVFASSVVFAYLCLKLYDEPVRLWLKNGLFRKQKG